MWLAYIEHLGCELRDEAAVGVYHTAHRLIGIVLLALLYATPLEAVYNVVVETLDVYRVVVVVGVIAKLAPVEGSDAVGKSFVNKELLEHAGVVALAHCHRHIEGTLPVGVGNHIEEHQLVAIENALVADVNGHILGHTVDILFGDNHS